MTASTALPIKLQVLTVPAAALTLGALATALFVWPAPVPRIRTVMGEPVPLIEAPALSETRREIRRIAITPAAVVEPEAMPVAERDLPAEPIRVIAWEPEATDFSSPPKKIVAAAAPVRRSPSPRKASDARRAGGETIAVARRSKPAAQPAAPEESPGIVDRTVSAGLHAGRFVVASARDTKDAALGLGRTVVGFVGDRL